MDLADRSPPSEQEKLPAGPIIEQLPEPLLTKIFSYLPLKDRYLLVLVSAKWAAASRVAWTDVTFLNLASIPRAMADPILGLCPRLETIEAKDHVIILDGKPSPRINENVRTIKLRSVKFAGKGLSPLIPSDATTLGDVLRPSSSLITEYFKRFPKLAYLTLRDCEVTYMPPHTSTSADANEDGPMVAVVKAGLAVILPQETAASLKSLLLTRPPNESAYVNVALIGLQNLVCAFLNSHYYRRAYLDTLPRLRELCVVDNSYALNLLTEDIAAGKFPNLEVLVYASDCCINPVYLTRLLTTKLALQVLVIAGKDTVLALDHLQHDLQQELGLGQPDAVQYPIVLPARQFPPDSAEGNKSHFPPLQIFIGGDFTKHVRFTLPKTEVANFWRIDCPLPEYLSKPEVAEVFKGVWAVKILREGPENGLLPWGHPDKMKLFFSTEPLLFC